MGRVDSTMTRRQHFWLSLMDVALFNWLAIAALQRLVGWGAAAAIVIAASFVIRAAITAERLWRIEPGADR